MKILKVKIKKKRTAGQCNFEYPDDWDAGKISVLAYEDHPENLGDVEEACLCVTDDETAKKLLKHPEVQKITVGEANEFGKRWRPARVKITDEDKVCGIIRKALSHPDVVDKLNDVLEKIEVDALNENNPEPGIGKGKKFDINDFI